MGFMQEMDQIEALGEDYGFAIEEIEILEKLEDKEGLLDLSYIKTLEKKISDFSFAARYEYLDVSEEEHLDKEWEKLQKGFLENSYEEYRNKLPRGEKGLGKDEYYTKVVELIEKCADDKIVETNAWGKLYSIVLGEKLQYDCKNMKQFFNVKEELGSLVDAYNETKGMWEKERKEEEYALSRYQKRFNGDKKAMEEHIKNTLNSKEYEDALQKYETFKELNKQRVKLEKELQQMQVAQKQQDNEKLYQEEILQQRKKLEQITSECETLRKEHKKEISLINATNDDIKMQKSVTKVEVVARKFKVVEKKLMDKADRLEIPDFTADIKKIANEFLERKDIRKGLHINTKEYNNMIHSLKELRDWTPEKGSIKSALGKLQKNTMEYLKAKEQQNRKNPSALRRTRLEFAGTLFAFAETMTNTVKYAEKYEDVFKAINNYKAKQLEAKKEVLNKRETIGHTNERVIEKINKQMDLSINELTKER